jgi:hypothetical protein
VHRDERHVRAQVAQPPDQVEADVDRHDFVAQSRQRVLHACP